MFSKFCNEDVQANRKEKVEEFFLNVTEETPFIIQLQTPHRDVVIYIQREVPENQDEKQQRLL